jgi:hypothetical protein
MLRPIPPLSRCFTCLGLVADRCIEDGRGGGLTNPPLLEENWKGWFAISWRSMEMDFSRVRLRKSWKTHPSPVLSQQSDSGILFPFTRPSPPSPLPSKFKLLMTLWLLMPSKHSVHAQLHYLSVQPPLTGDDECQTQHQMSRPFRSRYHCKKNIVPERRSLLSLILAIER